MKKECRFGEKIKVQAARLILAANMTVWSLLTVPIYANASSSGAEAVKSSFGNFTDVLAAVVQSFGSIFLMWGMLEMGMSMQTQDGGAQASAFKRIGGGLLCTIGPAIVVGLIG